MYAFCTDWQCCLTNFLPYRTNGLEVQGLNIELGAALEKLFHHKLHIQQTLEQVQHHVEGVKQDIAVMTV